MSTKYETLHEPNHEDGEIVFVRTDTMKPKHPVRSPDRPAPVVCDQRVPRVYELPLSRQSPFIQKTLALLLLAMGFTLGIVYAILHATNVSDVVVEHPWVQVVFWFVFLTIAFVNVCLDRTVHRAGRNAHIAVFVSNVLLTSPVISVLAAGLDEDRDIVLRAVLFTGLMIFCIIIFVIQTKFRFNSCCGYCVVLVCGIGALVFIYLPYLSDAFSGNVPENISRIDWTDPPRTGWSFVISLVMAMLLMLYFMFHFFDILKRCDEDDIFYAANRAYTDIESVVPVIMRMNCSCSKGLPWTSAMAHGTHTAAAAAPAAAAATARVPEPLSATVP